MISVQEATSIILSNVFVPTPESVNLNKSVGRILAQPVFSDRDLPPFHRVSMDGIAISSSSFAKGQLSYAVEGVQAAGTPQLVLRSPDACIEVMTGAVLPVGTDTVIPYEDLEIKDKVARILSGAVSPAQNIHRQGQDAAKGQELLSPGIKISPAEVALLASIGCDRVSVFAFPGTAIISTGDELVPVDTEPLPHQIRRSNDMALQAALQALGCPAKIFHLTDSKEALDKDLHNILRSHELIILSGGVSKGKFDFIPAALEANGIRKLFHHVSQKPGKPFWFGVSQKGQVVFALPGNPVSTYMCFYRYIRPWLMKSLGADLATPQAILAREFRFRPDLTYFLQVKAVNESGKLMAYPDAGGGSGDFANLKNVDGFLELPRDREHFLAGEAFPYFPFRA